MSVWAHMWRVMTYRPWWSVLNVSLRVVTFVLLLVPGLVLKVVFDALSRDVALPVPLALLLGLLVGLEVTRLLLGNYRASLDVTIAFTVGELLRRNLLRNVFDKPGALPLPTSPGEALSRFRDDSGFVMDGAWYFYWTAAEVIGTLIAVTILLTVDARLTLLALAPMLLVGVIVTRARVAIEGAQRRTQEATSNVTTHLSETFGAMLAVQAHGAQEGAAKRFEALSADRGEHAVRNSLLRSLLDALFTNISTISAGIVVLLGARALQSGSFTIGDFALFQQYLPFVAFVPLAIGRLLTQVQRIDVSLDRMESLTPSSPAETLTRHETRPLEEPRALPPLRALSVTDVRCLYPSSGRGVQDASFTVRGGHLTVIVGPVGSGKTTLLRAVLGLLPAEGDVRWNGELVRPGRDLTPPNAAFVPQAPRLFSQTLLENLTFEELVAADRLDAALAVTTLDVDVAALPRGLETQVGPRGMKLSGGQVQRAAITRSALRRAQLFVLDDVTTALDGGTQQQLWSNLLARGGTVLAVTHHPIPLRRADQILVLEDGVITDRGTLAELLPRNELLQAIWKTHSA